jgi:arginine/lysine/ornithine decarboxylase
VLSALVLSGAVPVYLPARWLDRGGPIPPTLDELELVLGENPDARAVLLTHPTYYGVGRELAQFSDACHRRGIPLLVDEAHGAHLKFLQHDLRSALDSGADAVVQSVHKTAGSLVGTAQLHRGHGSLVSSARLQSTINLLQSTSSSYLLLASLDLTRRWLWNEGRAVFARAVDEANRLRKMLERIGVETLAASNDPHLAHCHNDPLRLVVDVAGIGLSGFDAEQRLFNDFGILDELCDHRNVVFVLGPVDEPSDYRRLEDAFRTLAARGSTRVAPEGPSSMTPPPVAITPRDAAFAAKTRIPLDQAEGRICGETITMYPPGIPLVCLGERITNDVLEHCRDIAGQPVRVFAEDSSLNTITVIAEGTDP